MKFVHMYLSIQGLYPENHGVLANRLYDSKLGQLCYGYELFHYNESTVPIWVSLVSIFDMSLS